MKEDKKRKIIIYDHIGMSDEGVIDLLHQINLDEPTYERRCAWKLGMNSVYAVEIEKPKDGIGRTRIDIWKIRTGTTNL